MPGHVQFHVRTNLNSVNNCLTLKRHEIQANLKQKFKTVLFLSNVQFNFTVKYLPNWKNIEWLFYVLTFKTTSGRFIFSLEIHTVNSWGYLQSDGTIDGLVDLLNNSKIDFGGSPLFFKYERFPIIDYSVSTWILR